jgi:hypothetical protein
MLRITQIAFWRLSEEYSAAGEWTSPRHITLRRSSDTQQLVRSNSQVYREETATTLEKACFCSAFDQICSSTSDTSPT